MIYRIIFHKNNSHYLKTTLIRPQLQRELYNRIILINASSLAPTSPLEAFLNFLQFKR